MRIGVFASKLFEEKYNVDQHYVGDNYIRSLEAVGATVILIPYSSSKDRLQEYIDLCDGFVVPGGKDVDPSFYGEKNEGLSVGTEPFFDQYELDGIDMIIKTGKPILGICRGIQIINVYFKGTLWQDIPSEVSSSLRHVQDSDRHVGTHEVQIEQDSLLYSMFGNSLLVNSFHHQAVKDVGEGLRVIARSSDGVIEAVEAENYPLLAVQWHPEGFIKAENNPMLPIFTWLLEQAKS